MTTTTSSEAELSSVKYSNDFRLTSLTIEFNKRSTLMNHYLTNGQLDKAWVMAEALGTIARGIQFRLIDILAAKNKKENHEA